MLQIDCFDLLLDCFDLWVSPLGFLFAVECLLYFHLTLKFRFVEVGKLHSFVLA
jgi:hypothetical protein